MKQTESEQRDSISTQTQPIVYSCFTQNDPIIDQLLMLCLLHLRSFLVHLGRFRSLRSF